MEEIWDKTKIRLVALAHFQKRRRVKRYGFPIVLISLVFLAKQYLHPFLGNNSAFLLVSFVVAASAWYGGLGPGFFATGISTITVYVLYLSNDINYHPNLSDFVVLMIFIVEGLIISIVSEARYQMENQKDEFISFVSHELKNPLTAIKGFSQLIWQSVKKNSYTKIGLYAEEINAQSERILELINDLLDITKIEIGKFTYQESIFYIDDVVDEVIKHQRIISPNRVIQRFGHARKPISADRYRIRQVVVNLLTNAIKYSPDTKRIVVRLKMQRNSVLINVKDFGIGIPRDEQSRIFERYYRTRDVQKKRSEGIGLGLYITNQIVQNHNGRIWVESRVGKGSTFFVSLPYKRLKHQ
ncbi:MAG: HAMP domain-containing histidine kinase [Candidatus Levybacteria bacterium]|nr:HAMP domain-containing histidine kinase [Candidatus Levybacteria bacterium]